MMFAGLSRKRCEASGHLVQTSRPTAVSVLTELQTLICTKPENQVCPSLFESLRDGVEVLDVRRPISTN